MPARETWHNVGQKVRYLRKTHQLTLRQLAKDCGISPNAISLLERGEVAPTVATLCKIAAALGTPVSSFFQEFPMNKVIDGAIFIILSLGFIGCAEQPAPTPPLPPHTPVAAVEVHIPDLEKGQAAWREAKCLACHGPTASGGIGPQLASTSLSYEQFLQAVREVAPAKPAYPEAQLPDLMAYDIYAWVRTQISPVQWTAPGTSSTPSQRVEAADTMAMTLWTSHQCDKCHGVFAQGGPDAPALAGLNYPVEEELARMRSDVETIPEHNLASISDEVFAQLYEWLKMGCVRDECYH